MLPSLSISKAQAGIIYFSYFIAYTAFAPLLGLLSDRYDVRIMLTVFVALMGAGAFLMAYPRSQLQASLFFAVAGVGCSACWAPVMGLAQRWTSDKRRGMSLAFVDAGSSFDSFIDIKLRYTAGLGVRWVSPMGPIRLEWGYNLDKKPGEKAGRFEFAFGSFF